MYFEQLLTLPKRQRGSINQTKDLKKYFIHIFIRKILNLIIANTCIFTWHLSARGGPVIGYIVYHLVYGYKYVSLGRHRLGVLVFFHLKSTLIT